MSQFNLENVTAFDYKGSSSKVSEGDEPSSEIWKTRFSDIILTLGRTMKNLSRAGVRTPSSGFLDCRSTKDKR